MNVVNQANGFYVFFLLCICKCNKKKNDKHFRQSKICFEKIIFFKEFAAFCNVLFAM